MPPQLPTASDLAILAGAIWDSEPARLVRGTALVLPALGVILVLAAGAAVEDRICDSGGRW